MPNHRWGDPDTRDVMTFVNASLPLNQQETRFLYAFGRFSRREANSAGFFRRSLDNRNWPQIYPLGIPAGDQTGSASTRRRTVGVRGQLNRWTYDVSGTYGRNTFDFTIGDTLNVSLGPSMPPNKTEFDAGSLGLNQFVANLDVRRPVRVARARGAAERRVRRGVPARGVSA